MLTPEERKHTIDLADRLIELYVERREARETNDEARVNELQNEINRVDAKRRAILAWDTVGST